MARSGKTCIACQLTKPLSEFARDARRTDGLDSRCRSCEATRQRAARSRGFRKTPDAD